MWTDTTRAQYARADLALPSDLTDAEWALPEPFFPPASHVGRPRKWPLRRIVEAILYLLRRGPPWRMLPPCFPPFSTVRRWFFLWRDNKLWLSLNHTQLLISQDVAFAALGQFAISRSSTAAMAAAKIRPPRTAVMPIADRHSRCSALPQPC